MRVLQCSSSWMCCNVSPKFQVDLDYISLDAVKSLKSLNPGNRCLQLYLFYSLLILHTIPGTYCTYKYKRFFFLMDGWIDGWRE